MPPPVLKNVIRLDSFPLNQTFFTPEGYLRDRPVLTRTGIFEYTNNDGSTRRELRLPEEVFDPESLASYKSKPIIITHDAGLIDKSNVHENSVGTILSEGYRSDDAVRAEIVIHDTDAMKESDLKELSLGYNLDLDETPGEWNGQKYDAIQRNIRINHLALVREARAGDRARLNIDGRSKKNSLQGGKVMKGTRKKNSNRNDGILSPEELEKAIAEYKKRYKPDQETAVKDGDEEEAPAVVETTPTPEAPVAEEKKDAENVVAPAGEEKKPIEEQVEEIKEARKEDADEDMQKLFDIIDTLLAQREFDSAEPEDDTEAETEAEDGEDEECENEDEDEEEEEFEFPPKKKEELQEDEDDDEIPTTEEGDLKGTVNADSIDRVVRARIQVGMVGKALNLDGLENMNLMSARKAVVKAVRPSINLDGKSKAFINAAYEMACSEVSSRNKKNTQYQKKQMFNKDAAAAKADNSSAAAARERMIARRQRNED